MRLAGKLHGLLNVLGATPLAGLRVLDVGTGVGIGAWALAERGAAEVVSITMDARDDARARARLPAPILDRVRLECADLAAGTELTKASFSFALADHFVSAVDAYTPGRRTDALGEVARLVSPGGQLCLVDEAPRSPPQANTWLAMLFSLLADVAPEPAPLALTGYCPVAPPVLCDELARVGWTDIRTVRAPVWDLLDVMYLRANLEWVERLNNESARLSVDALRCRLDALRVALGQQGPMPAPMRYVVWARRV